MSEFRLPGSPKKMKVTHHSVQLQIISSKDTIEREREREKESKRERKREGEGE